MNLKETILKFADDMQENMVACRRDLHAHPEPGWTEFRTAAKVAKTLAELGYTVKTGADTIRQDAMMGVPSAENLAKEQQRAIAEGADPDWVKKMDGGRTGVLGVMKFSEDGPVVAVRFDMDSNDVTETGEASHRANKEGFARDDDTGNVLSSFLLPCIGYSSRRPSFRAQREIFFVPFFPPPSLSRLRETPPPTFPAIRCFPFLAAKHAPSYRQRKRFFGFASNDDTWDIPLPRKKSPSQSWSFFVSERLICQTVRAWCLLLLQYQ